MANAEQRAARELQRKTGDRYTTCLARVRVMAPEDVRKLADNKRNEVPRG